MTAHEADMASLDATTRDRIRAAAKAYAAVAPAFTPEQIKSLRALFAEAVIKFEDGVHAA